MKPLFSFSLVCKHYFCIHVLFSLFFYLAVCKSDPSYLKCQLSFYSLLSHVHLYDCRYQMKVIGFNILLYQ